MLKKREKKILMHFLKPKHQVGLNVVILSYPIKANWGQVEKNNLCYVFELFKTKG